jgi:ankyrin repeat protein
MPLLDLAGELLLAIAKHLESERDISALTRVNHYIYGLLNAYLYLYNVQQSGSSALLWAALHGKEKTADKSLEEGANPQATTDDGSTPLFLAARNGREAVVKLLLAKGGVDPDSKDKVGRTPLSRATEEGHDAVVKLLLGTHVVNVHAQDYDLGDSPLSLARAGEHKAVMALFESHEDWFS